MGIWETNAFKGIIKDHRNDRRLMGAKKIHRDFIGPMGCLWIPMGLLEITMWFYKITLDS